MPANSALQQAGQIVGRPALRFSLNDSHCEPEWVVADTISLTSTQAQEFFELLQANECALREMAETDAAVAKTRMAAAVRLLIDYLLSEGNNHEQDMPKGEEATLASWISDSARI